MRVALLHDYFEKPGLSGGGENLAITVARAFKADIYTAYVHRDFEMPKDIVVKEILPNAAETMKGSRTIKIMHAFETLDIPNYDLYIFSGTNCITASERLRPNLLYCHTPPRWIYDLKDWYNKHTNVFGRIALTALRKKVQPLDQYYMRKFDKVVANSMTVKNRIAKYYNDEIKNVDVVYSFLDLSKYKKYKKAPMEEFYLSTARLDPLKRIDVIVKAFQRIPKKLVVISSGPMLDEIRKMANDYDNIVVLGWVPEDKMLDLLSKCIATIQLPINEDLGLGPMESMAMGKPCIAANEGGPAETIINNKTGLLIEPTIENVVEAVDKMTMSASKKMRKACLVRAKDFSKERFIAKMQKAAKEAIKSYESRQLR